MIDDDVPLLNWITILVWVVLFVLIGIGVLIVLFPKAQDAEPAPYKQRVDSYVYSPNISYYPKFKYSILASITGYNAEREQTDDTPFTMASGNRVYEGAIANNCLPFGTRIKINERWYFVEDRMNSKYGCSYFDIFFWDKNDALSWGRRTIKIEVHK